MRPVAAVDPGISPEVKPSRWGSPMPTSNRSASRPWSKRLSVTSRTAVYGPVRTVVREGRSREAPPYPDRHFMGEGGVVAFAIAKRRQLRHLHDVAVRAVKGAGAAVFECWPWCWRKNSRHFPAG